MPWVGLQLVIVVFPDHTHLLFAAMGVGRGQFPSYTVLPNLPAIIVILRIGFNAKISGSSAAAKIGGKISFF